MRDDWELKSPMPWWQKGKPYLICRILRGQPVIYRVNLIAPLKLSGTQNVRITDCVITNDGSAVGVVEITP